MKIALFTDIHWGRRNNSPEHNQDCMDFIEWFCEQVKKDPQINCVGFLGDWFESRNAVDISTLNAAYKGAQRLSELNLPVYFCVGNHDLYKRHARDKFSTVHYSDINNFHVVDEPAVHNGMLFVPFLFEEEYTTLKKYSNIPIWLGHFEFAGFSITSYNTVKEGGPVHTDFKDQMILSGHFHKRQTKDRTTFIGNVFPMDYGDAGETERGMAILDYSTQTLSFIDWTDGPSYHRVNFSDLKSKTFPPKARVKCIIDEDVEYEITTTTKKTVVEQFKLREFSFEDIKVSISEVTDVEVDDGEDDIKSIKHLLFKMIDLMDVESMDKSLLKSILEQSGEFDDSLSNNIDPITFNKISMRNFMSFGNNDSEVNLKKIGFNSIVGRNMDYVLHETPDQNGVGKTTILNAICYTLFDKAIDPSISSDDMINNFNRTNMMCKLSMNVGDVEYVITRRRKAGKTGKTNDVSVIKIKDGVEEDLTKDSATNTNKMIKTIIGLEYETFVRIVVYSATNTPFLSLPITSASQISQTDILEDLFKQKELTLKAESIKKYQKQINDKLALEQKLVERDEITYKEHLRKLDQIKQQEHTWDEAREKDIEDLENLLASVPNDIDDQIDRFNQAETIKKEIVVISNSLRILEAKLSQAETSKIEKSNIIASLSSSLCPFCKQSHIDEDKLKQTQHQLHEIETTIDDIFTQCSILTEDFENKSNELKQLIEDMPSNIKTLMDLKNKKTTYEIRLEEIRKSVNPYSLTLEMMEDTVIQQPSYDEVHKLTRIVEHCQFLVKILTKKDSHVRKALLKRNLPFLNKKINEYLNALGLPHKIEVTDELSTVIKLRGKQFNFATLSAGQKARMNIAFSVAFRDVLIRMHSPINIYMLDECLDHGLSHQGAVAAAKLLRSKSRSENLNVMIITHREEVAAMNFDSVITVILENGFSRIDGDAI